MGLNSVPEEGSESAEVEGPIRSSRVKDILLWGSCGYNGVPGWGVERRVLIAVGGFWVCWI